MTRVAFLGLGAMGRPMAGRLLEAGHDVTVWNRTPGRDEALVARDARRAATPAAAADGAEVAITMLADPAALADVALGADGLAETLAPTATLVEMSTVGPAPVRAVAERLAPAAVLDAPVIGSVPAAESGGLTLLVGGDPDVLARHAELLGVFGTILHVGPSGAGATAKLAANAAAISALVAVGEVLALTDRAGLDPATVLDVLRAGPLASFVDRWRPKIEAPFARVDFRLGLAHKDLALILEEAGATGLDLTLPAAAYGRLGDAVDAGEGDLDLGAVVASVRS